MKARLNSLVLSATDLSNHLGCRHLTTLEHAVARNERARPGTFDPRLETLRERGLEHEKAYLAHLRDRGIEVLELSEGGSEDAALRATEEAMRRGVDAIAQATLADVADGLWHGRADVLLRVERPSGLGPWSYEPVDTKLARETKAGTILQLLVYAELLVPLQGVLPEHVSVVTPESLSEPERYRVAEYRAFANRVRRSLAESLRDRPGTYPLPVPHCDVCRWYPECDARWRADDHVCLVAGVGRLHERELASRDVRTLAGFAALPLPLQWTPVRGSKETFERLREQARVQLAARESGRPVWERLPAVKDHGLARLPEPSPGDLFLDLEGDPYAGEGGLEYLFGTVDVTGEYRARWALGRAEERAAFEALVDGLTERWEREPGFHVYHFGAYEPGALKRLMGRYATREDGLDRLLRGERFVDLHRVVTQGLRVGVESYSIKKLEPAYDFVREVEKDLELGRTSEIGDELRQAVERYNRDDCVSTLRLRDWLERERAAAIEEGADLPRPVPRAPAPFDRSGLFFLPVDHAANQNQSVEEADAVAALVKGWLVASAEWTDRDGLSRRLAAADILIVTPYNAQLRLLRQRLPGFRIGTVDKFQGQEAPVLIYSMVSSSPEEAPRGMEFLYSRNRLNVATSRARCACVLVASPRLLEAECRSPRQMRLANALCSYAERAVRV